MMERCGLSLCDSGEEKTIRCCEDINEIMGSTKCG